jgi:predicted transcriptional regulator
MTRNPVTIDARDPVSSAIQIMKKRSYSQLPVLRGNRIVGMITESDIVQNLDHDINKLSVQAVMDTTGVPILSDSTPVTSILPLFQTYQAVLVHDQGRLSGIITRSDLLRIQI